MRLRKASCPIGRTALITMFLLLFAGASGNIPAASETSNPMRWEGHDAVLNNGVAWQQTTGEGRWVTFVVLTDRPVPPDLLANPNVLNPHESHGEDPMTKVGAQALLFQVMTGGIPEPSGLDQDVWFHDGEKLRTSALSGAGGIDI